MNETNRITYTFGDPGHLSTGPDSAQLVMAKGKFVWTRSLIPDLPNCSVSDESDLATRQKIILEFSCTK